VPTQKSDKRFKSSGKPSGVNRLFLLGTHIIQSFSGAKIKKFFEEQGEK
jgi:hypothetical protein